MTAAEAFDLRDVELYSSARTARLSQRRQHTERAVLGGDVVSVGPVGIAGERRQPDEVTDSGGVGPVGRPRPQLGGARNRFRHRERRAGPVTRGG
jgi:hypothetical protein